MVKKFACGIAAVVVTAAMAYIDSNLGVSVPIEIDGSEIVYIENRTKLFKSKTRDANSHNFLEITQDGITYLFEDNLSERSYSDSNYVFDSLEHVTIFEDDKPTLYFSCSDGQNKEVCDSSDLRYNELRRRARLQEMLGE